MSQRLPLPGTTATSVFVDPVLDVSVRGVTLGCDELSVVPVVVGLAGALEPQPSNVISVMDLHIDAENITGLTGQAS
jgi:hypothetical protein